MMDRRVREYVIELGSEISEPKGRVKAIIEMVRKKFDVELTYDAVRKLLGRIDEMREKIADANEATPGKKDYEVRDGKYILNTKHGVFSLTVEQVDEIFLDFSSKGRNLSSEEILKKWRLKPEVWVAIKNKLRLYKASNTVSPHSAETLPENELEAKIEDAVGSHIDRIKDRLVQSHQKKFKAEALRAFKILGSIDEFLSHVREFIKDYKPEPVEYEAPKAYAPGVATVFLADIHVGKQGTKEIVARLTRALEEAKSCPEGEIVVVGLGDLAETLSPTLMHDSQIDTLEERGVFKTMLMVADILRKFLVALAKSGKKVTFHGIGGNHDRIARGHDQDMQRTGALVIYEFVRLGLENTDIAVNYYVDKINTFRAGNVNYIIHHGDDGFSNRKMEDILWKNGDRMSYNVIAHGDKHALSMKETKSGMMICVPALAGEGEYDKRLDLHSQPAIIIVKENAMRTVDVLLKRL